MIGFWSAPPSKPFHYPLLPVHSPFPICPQQEGRFLSQLKWVLSRVNTQQPPIPYVLLLCLKGRGVYPPCLDLTFHLYSEFTPIFFFKTLQNRQLLSLLYFQLLLLQAVLSSLPLIGFIAKLLMESHLHPCFPLPSPPPAVWLPLLKATDTSLSRSSMISWLPNPKTSQFSLT